MQENKKDDLYYCFRYRCKNCPKNAECEKESEMIKNVQDRK